MSNAVIIKAGKGQEGLKAEMCFLYFVQAFILYNTT